MYLTANFPDCLIGMGNRYAVATKGRKWVHVFYIPTLTGFSMRPSEFDLLRPKQVEAKPKAILRALKAKRALYEGLGLQYSAEAADRAKATLRALVS